MLLIGCYHDEVLNPSEPQGLKLFCLFIYFLAQSRGLSLLVHFFPGLSVSSCLLNPFQPSLGLPFLSLKLGDGLGG